MDRVYLDYAATTPCDPEVMAAMQPFFYERFGNASSPHFFGRRARKAMEDAREELAGFIGAKPEEIVFTSGATEANNLAILGTARALKPKGRHLIIGAIEHHSILEPARQLAKEGYQITYVPPDPTGIISPFEIQKALQSDTILVAVGHANNEIGAIEPIEDIGYLCREAKIYLLTDIAQTIGHIPVDVSTLRADFASLSAHKFYGPQGVGALFMRKGVTCGPWLLGGDQERGRRASTQNVAGTVGMAKAVGLCRNRMDQEAGIQQKLRDELIDAVLSGFAGVVLNGPASNRLPNNAHFSFPNTDGEELVARLDLAGVACSVGSACTSGQLEPSHVLKAIGLSDRMALGSLRVTLGRWSSRADSARFIQQLKIIDPCKKK